MNLIKYLFDIFFRKSLNNFTHKYKPFIDQTLSFIMLSGKHVIIIILYLLSGCLYETKWTIYACHFENLLNILLDEDIIYLFFSRKIGDIRVGIELVAEKTLHHLASAY